MQTETIELVKPITRGDKTISEITLRRPDSGSLRGLALTDLLRMETEALDEIAPRICQDLVRGDVLNLDPYDLLQVGKVITGFLVTPPQ